MFKGKKIAIIGGGIIGLAIGYKLSQKHAKVSIFEKEFKEGLHQSGRNSGVLHCGLYYKPGSLKAKLSIDGIKEMINFCSEHKINHDICGKVVVATDDSELNILDKLARQGKKNGLMGLKYLSSSELKKREPFVKAKRSLLVPQEGIIDYKAVMQKMVELIEQNNGQINYNTIIKKLYKKVRDKISIKTFDTTYNFDYLVSCTGLWSDITYKNLIQKNPPLQIIPFRGEYLKIKSPFINRVNHLVYPVPKIEFPFLGVHFTRMIDGTREIGPNAVLALKREGYSKLSFSAKETLQSLTYSGFIRFIYKNFSFSLNEFKSSLFLNDFVKKAQKMIPDIDARMLETGPSGIRAQAILPSGELEMDFNVVKKGRQIHVLNAPSPGATASLAIASHIIEKYLT